MGDTHGCLPRPSRPPRPSATPTGGAPGTHGRWRRHPGRLWTHLTSLVPVCVAAVPVCTWTDGNGSLRSDNRVRHETPRDLGKPQRNKNSTETEGRTRRPARWAGPSTPRGASPGARGIWWQAAAQREHTGQRAAPPATPPGRGTELLSQEARAAAEGSGVSPSIPGGCDCWAGTGHDRDQLRGTTTQVSGHVGSQGRARGCRHAARHGGRVASQDRGLHDDLGVLDVPLALHHPQLQLGRAGLPLPSLGLCALDGPL